MTYTLAIRSDSSHEIGVGITTCSFAFGGQAPFYTVAGDLIVSQAFASRDDGYQLAARLSSGATIDQGFQSLKQTDPDLSFRQILVMPVQGAGFAFTGADTRPWSGHITEDDFVCAGNVLADSGVLEAMADSVRNTAGQALAERLLMALEAGREAGGQAAGGVQLSERSALLKVTRTDDKPGYPELDLRVDMHPSALHEMRRLLDVYRIYEDYANNRDKRPRSTPSMAEYETAHQQSHGVIVERPSIYR